MSKLTKIKNNLLWKFYYGYKPLFFKDEDGSYSIIEKILMFANLTYVRNWGEYWIIDKIKDKIEYNSDHISDIIYNTLNNDNPCMIARFGSIEQTVVANYISIRKKTHNIFDIITGRSPYYWWDKKMRNELKTNAGFFPNTKQFVERYCATMIEDTKMLDVLATWYGKEPIIIANKNAIQLIGLQESEPWWQTNPWTRYLTGKKVVVVHPFAELIENQYKNRQYIFKNKDILPEFELRTVKAVQSINGECNNYSNWFEALDWMKNEMDKEDYDVALIGCGAYGFCLAAHAKRMGKKAIHMGGVLQLLFGIKGKRWENKNYHPIYDYTTLFNNYWVKPYEIYKPQNSNNVENGCYW